MTRTLSVRTGVVAVAAVLLAVAGVLAFGGTKHAEADSIWTVSTTQASAMGGTTVTPQDSIWTG